MAVVRHTAGGDQWNSLFTRYLGDKRIKTWLKFRRNQVLAVFRGIHDVQVIVGVGMPHGGESYHPGFGDVGLVWCRASGARVHSHTSPTAPAVGSRFVPLTFGVALPALEHPGEAAGSTDLFKNGKGRGGGSTRLAGR